MAELPDYIRRIRLRVEDLHNRVMRTKDNIQEIQRLVNTWSEDPFFVRNDDLKGKNLLLLLTDRDTRVQGR